MIPTFVIFLREGVEASMIVAILLAYLDKIGQRRHFRDVFVGVAAAAVLIAGGGVAAYLVIKQYNGSQAQTVFETVTYLLAATVLTYMTFWMQAHSRTLSSDLEQRSRAALDGRARFGLGALAFQAVGREGVETMVFTLAIVFASSSQSATGGLGGGLLVGAALGLLVSLAIAYTIFKLGRRLNLALFFRIIGVTLMVFAAGLLADAVQNMQELGWLPFLDQGLWNSSQVLSENSTPGDLVHSLFGYADHPTVLQVAVWAGYIAIATSLFIVRGRRGRTQLPPAAAAAAAAAEQAELTDARPAVGREPARAPVPQTAATRASGVGTVVRGPTRPAH